MTANGTQLPDRAGLNGTNFQNSNNDEKRTALR
jgi:hypothetical protein